ncbi:hypothetical protein [Aquabacterium sp.]|uniref:hypothetical protein n=1 Tax=Aquabacterium sp. TaxID=1872578 RepID=UPI003783C463
MASIGAALLSALCLVLALGLGWHHPLVGAGSALPIGLIALAAWRWRWVALAAVPALLPLVDLTPWTGWLLVEEFDLLLLAAAAGAYGRLAWPAPEPPAPDGGVPRLPAVPLVSVLLVLLALGSVGLSMWRGVADAGGWQFGWTQGYREPMNALRLAKALPAALLWWPLWRAACRQDLPGAQRLLLRGLTLGLAGCAMAALYERLAFTELLNFSSDYRTTALFWEMHVGGAALDGYLAMTLPFAVLLGLQARGRADLGLALFTLLLAGYAALTTFSRIVYVALPAGLALMAVLVVRQRLAGRDADARRQLGAQLLPAALLLAGFAVAAFFVFGGAGYRGLLALIGCVWLMLPLAHEAARFGRAEWSAGLLLGLVAAGLSLAAATAVPKAPYIAFGLWLLASGALLAWRLRQGPPTAGPSVLGALALAGFIAALAAMVQVADHWGYAKGLAAAWPVALLLFGVFVAAATQPRLRWPAAPRWHGLMATALVAMAAMVAVFGGGAYMTERLSASEGDLGGREAHWRRGIGLTETAEQQWLGIGLGRYPEHYAMTAGPQERPGDFRRQAEGDRAWLVMAAGTHMIGWGEILRVSQRIAPPEGRLTVAFDARADKPVNVHVDVCKKHLLYDDGGCQVRNLEVPATQGQWQHFSQRVDGEGLPPDPWYLPRVVVFSIGSETGAVPVALAHLSLKDASGRELLHNGDFEDRGSGGLARWFFSSDRFHLPWHAKNLAVHLWVEQGGLGLLIAGLVWLAAMGRVTLGSAAAQPLAPALAAALLGFMIVGLVDSLLDMPRVAWQYHVLALVALTLQLPYRSRRGAVRHSISPPVDTSARRGPSA